MILAAAAASAALPTSAAATYPGRDGRLVYTLEKGGDELCEDGVHQNCGRITQSIYSIRSDGRGRKKLLDCEERQCYAWRPMWSPDGRRIAYSNGAVALRVMRADGSGNRRVGSVAAFQPTWSPDGRELAYARYFADGTEGIFRIGVRGGGEKRVTRGRDSVPDWSFRNVIAFNRAPVATSEIDMWTVRAHGGDATRVTHRHVDELSWAPGGRRFVFGGSGSLYVKAAGGGRPRRIEGLHGYHPVWSPSGRRVVYEGDEGIRIANIDGSRDHLVPRIAPGAAVSSWQPLETAR